MIFKQWKQVLSGEKTQTRRICKEGEYLDTVKTANGVVLCIRGSNDRIKWYVGQVLAVQPGRGQKSVGRIRLIKIRREHLHNILLDGIKAEGYPYEWPPLNWNYIYEPPVAWFRDLWNSIHKKPGTRFEDNREVWVLTFERVT